MKNTILLLSACLLLALAPARALDNGLARTPPMGWNSWNKFGCNVSEKLDKGNGGRHGDQRNEGCRVSVRGD